MSKSKRLIISKSKQWLPLSRKKGDGVKEGHLSILKTWQCLISHCGGDFFIAMCSHFKHLLKKKRKKNSHLYVWLSSSINIFQTLWQKEDKHGRSPISHPWREGCCWSKVWQPWGTCCLLVALAGDALCGAESSLLRSGSWYPPGASLPLPNAFCWLVTAECLCSVLSVTTMSPLWLPSFQETELNSPPFECRLDSLARSYEIQCGRCDSVWLLRLGGKRHCDLPLALSLGKLILGRAGCHAMETPKQHSEEVQGVKSSCQ